MVIKVDRYCLFGISPDVGQGFVIRLREELNVFQLAFDWVREFPGLEFDKADS
jgi:hypothetical protein